MGNPTIPAEEEKDPLGGVCHSVQSSLSGAVDINVEENDMDPLLYTSPTIIAVPTQPEKPEAALLRSYGSVVSLYDAEDEGGVGGLSSTEATTMLSAWEIVCILSTSFSYGCIFSTLFLITLPIECERIHANHPSIPKSVALGVFVAIAGVTQLISPLIGRLSDMYVPPSPHDLGQRLPYLVLGSVCTVIGLLGQMITSFWGFWVRYSAFFFLHMIGMNIMYAMMLALLPDQVPKIQTGMANGILAMQLVLGSLFAFGLFYSILYQQIQSMYGLYCSIVIITTIATGTHAHDRDAELAFFRTQRRRQRLQRTHQENGQSIPPPTRNGFFNNHPEPDSPLKASKSDGPRWKRAARKAARKARQVLVLTPTRVLKSILVDPFQFLDWPSLWQSYSIDTTLHHNFFVVTVSRLFYYSGMSIQTFFLYYVHDMLHITDNPESVVAGLAILGQCSAMLTCYPVGIVSDRYLSGRRRPFVYLACAILFGACLSLVFINSLNQMLIVVVILGAANGIYLTMDTSLAVDTLPSDLEDSAQLLGVWGVAAFLGSAFGPMIGGPLLFVIGQQLPSSDDENEPGYDSESYGWAGYAVVVSLGAFYFFLSALILVFVRR